MSKFGFDEAWNLFRDGVFGPVARLRREVQIDDTIRVSGAIIAAGGDYEKAKALLESGWCA